MTSKRGIHVMHLLCVLVLTLLSGISASPCNDHSEIIKTLSEYVSDEQVKESRPLTGLTSTQETEGTYRAYVFINAHGPEEYAMIRKHLPVPTDHPFAASFVGPLILDTYRFGKKPKPLADDIMKIVKLFAENYDHNVPYNNSIEFFYTQRYDEEAGLWYSSPPNVLPFLGAASSQLPDSLSQMAFDIILGNDELPPGLEEAFSIPNVMERFRLTPDLDTSTLNMGFGAILSDLRDEYPDAWREWKAANNNLTSVFDQLKATAYRPFSDDRSVNTIDPRVYYYLRDFIDDAHREGRDLAIAPCWSWDIGREQDPATAHLGGMALGVNTVDAGISANILSMIFAAADEGVIHPDVINGDDDLKLVLESTAASLVYGLAHNLTDRPDLTINFYTIETELEWLVARGLLYMENANLRGDLDKVPVFSKYYQDVSHVMRTARTQRLLSTLQEDEDGDLFAEDFLGNGDFNYDGQPIRRGEDRYFTTATASIVFIYTWSVYDPDLDHLRWIDDVPDEVKDAVFGLARWLTKNPFGGKYGVVNTVYCTGISRRETYPFWYPANRYEFLNGTKIDMDYLYFNNVIFGMEGYVTPQEYDRLLAVDQFGYPTPPDFLGHNGGQGTGMCWAIEAMSYGSAMMALSLTDALYQSQHPECS